jgi:polyribonucleotide nucleotidyltransferase
MHDCFALPENAPYAEYKAAEERRGHAKEAFRTLEKKATHMLVAEQGIRAGGRDREQIRDLEMEVGIFARTHGSALFQRGETQSLVTCVLGSGRDEQIVDGLMPEYAKKFYLHYNFPPFCVGEAGRIMGPGRREVGHGALAERSLLGILPNPEDFPYTIRLVSDITESNGSSSMASVCGGCMALMDAGVPILNTCAGISVGRFTSSDGKITHVTDILGEEDFFGEMDFKVSGTKEGIAGIQLDLKALALILMKSTPSSLRRSEADSTSLIRWKAYSASHVQKSAQWLLVSSRSRSTPTRSASSLALEERLSVVFRNALDAP